MSRLEAALQRLYLLPQAEQPGLIDPSGRVRAMVLEVTGPAAWPALGAVWQGVQADLSLPAPAIAVSGEDGYQLWFSLREPTPATQAAAFLEGLRARYLSQVAPQRVRCLPEPATPATGSVRHARLVPAQHGPHAHWSAFVAPDLAPMFDEETWLDMPPSADGQADLLGPLSSIKPEALAQAMAQLTQAHAHADRDGEPEALKSASATAAAQAVTSAHASSPRQFLLDVMHDEAVELALRIEAAKALLPYNDDAPRTHSA